MFPINSRYYNIERVEIETPDGEKIVYLRRRFVPPPERFELLVEHSDPEQFWRVCDANGAVRPDELTETVGRKLRITLPEGIPGPGNA